MATDQGQAPEVVSAMTAAITGVTSVTLALIALMRRPTNDSDHDEVEAQRDRMERRYGVDSSEFDQSLVKVLVGQDARLIALTERSDRQDEKIRALEEREDALLAHVEDLKLGVEQGRYPPWPPVPH